MKIDSVKASLLGGVLAFGVGAYVAAEETADSARSQTAESAAEAAPGAIALVEQKNIDLGSAYPNLADAAGRTFRARKIALAPGERTPEMRGDGEPAIFYVTAGRVTEHRSDAGTPVAHELHADGALTKGVTHWIENNSNSPAELLIVDIITARAN